MRFKNLFDRTTVLVLMAVVGACDSSPTAPSVQPAATVGNATGQVFATIADPGLPQNELTLKATAPTLLSPPDGASVNDPAVVLSAQDPLPVYNVDWVFEVMFEIYANSNPGQPVYSRAVTQGQGTTSAAVPAGVLQDETLYVWRARAESQGGFGPWSAVFGFTTAFTKLEPPVLLAPVGGVVVDSLTPRLTVANGEVTGDPGTVSVQVEVSPDGAFPNGNTIKLTAHTRASGETNLFFRTNVLLAETLYFWRGRSTNKNLLDTNGVLSTSALPVQTAVELTTGWSEHGEVSNTGCRRRYLGTPSAIGSGALTRLLPAAKPLLGGPTGGRSDRDIRIPGISVHSFTQKVAERLHCGRWQLGSLYQQQRQSWEGHPGVPDQQLEQQPIQDRHRPRLGYLLQPETPLG